MLFSKLNLNEIKASELNDRHGAREHVDKKRNY